MKVRKNVVFAALAGTVISALGWLALTTPHAREQAPAKKAAEANTAAPQNPARSALASARADLPASSHPSPPRAAAPGKAASRARRKTTRSGRFSFQPTQGHTETKTAADSTPAQNAAAVQPDGTTQEGGASVPARTITAQEARAALREVGTNPEAEAIWTAAINDPNLPANQRKDLIEDLNEEGFADPKHLTAADLPRIQNRLDLIEELAPDALDQTNADAFQEAYKDLTSMYNRLAKP